MRENLPFRQGAFQSICTKDAWSAHLFCKAFISGKGECVPFIIGKQHHAALFDTPQSRRVQIHTQSLRFAARKSMAPIKMLC